MRVLVFLSPMTNVAPMTTSEGHQERPAEHQFETDYGCRYANRQSRRVFIQSIAASLAHLMLGSSVFGTLSAGRVARAEVRSLQAPDANGIRLPVGFSSRIVARSGRKVAARYRWHIKPDGGATFATDDGGWIYVSNSESSSWLGGGASAIRFAPTGTIVDAYRVLSGTNRNCAGGSTPWGTWLSCEEVDFGRVYECDPYGVKPAQVRHALGYFKHEAVAVDVKRGDLYLTEDEPDGCLYRFVPTSANVNDQLDLESGVLQVAQVEDGSGKVRWINVPDPRPESSAVPTRRQVPESSTFSGGEGICYHNDTIYFTTKGDGRVWSLKLDSQTLTIVYDQRRSTNPILTGGDNVTVFPTGDLLVAEDGGDMQIVAINQDGEPTALLQIVDQDESEITGPAFSPDGTRLYFSSQRGAGRIGELLGLGITYEVTGPFAQWFAG